jgi:hypothetical protein
MRRTPIALVSVAVTLAVSGATSNAGAAPSVERSCFSFHRLESTRPDGDQRLYFRVGLHDIYRVDLAFRCPALTAQQGIVLEPTGGMDEICTPLDLDLRARMLGGGSAPCMIRSITKLTPDEAASLSPKVKP